VTTLERERKDSRCCKRCGDPLPELAADGGDYDADLCPEDLEDQRVRTRRSMRLARSRRSLARLFTGFPATS
jgi:hypothetical protein